MFKTSILNLRVYRSHLKKSFRVHWYFLIVGLAAAVYGSFIVFSAEIAGLTRLMVTPSDSHGSLFYTDLVELAGSEVLWIGLFFLLAGTIAHGVSDAMLVKLVTFRDKSKAVYYMMIVTSLFFFATLYTVFTTLEQFPNSADEFAYVFQSEMFTDGKIWEPAHDLRDFFRENNIPQRDGIRVSRFPPGWPLLLSGANEIRMAPALVNPVIALIALVVFYFFARSFYGHAVAVWSLIGVALCGYFVFNAASFFSHMSCFLAALLFVYSLYLYRDKRRLAYGLLAGFFLGFAFLVRYYSAFLIFVPFLVYELVHDRLRSIKLFLLMGIGSLPCLAYLLWYNYSITGHAFLPVTVWSYPQEGLGFVQGHTPLKGFGHMVRRMLMFFYWCSPGFVILYFVLLWKKIKSPVARAEKPEDYAFLSLIIGYFFYYQIGGDQYGPRYLFEGFPFLVLFVVNRVVQTRERWAMGLLVASVVYALVKFPFISLREGRIVDQRQDLYDLVEEQHISNAVVFVASATSPIRPMATGDLTRNDPRFQNDVLYAIEIPKSTDAMFRYYPERSFYRYVREVDDPHGQLIRIR
jgi:hypothetical protein